MIKDAVPQPEVNHIPPAQTEAMEKMGLMASSIAHDFNNLLTSLMGHMSLALMKMSNNDEARPHMEKAIKTAEYASVLTTQLLNYSRSTPYGQTREYVDINDLIEDVVSLVGVVLLSGINFQVKLAQSLPLIKISRSQFQQIVMNLVINAAEAIDFPERGEITLSTGKFRATKMTHSMNVWQQQNIIPGDYVFLQVSDNGKGMPPETLENIFTPFYSTKPKGRGLGLSTVMDIVKNHNGYITVTSKVGRGTVFRIYFPSHPEKFSPVH